MEKTAESKHYGITTTYIGDMRKFMDSCLADGIHKTFTDSPVTDKLVMKDLCYRGKGFIGQHNKETKTSWDTLSYTLVQSHNVWMHMNAVQEANRRYEQGIIPKMVRDKFTGETFGNIVEEIFSQETKEDSIEVIKKHTSFWTQMQSGSQGFSGKKVINAMTMFDKLFEVENNDSEIDEIIEDSDEEMANVLED
jgi:hypothetical protein